MTIWFNSGIENLRSNMNTMFHVTFTVKYAENNSCNLQHRRLTIATYIGASDCFKISEVNSIALLLIL